MFRNGEGVFECAPGPEVFFKRRLMTGNHDLGVHGMRLSISPLSRNEEILAFEDPCHHAVFTGGDQVCFREERTSPLHDGAVKGGGSHTQPQGDL